MSRETGLITYMYSVAAETDSDILAWARNWIILAL